MTRLHRLWIVMSICWVLWASWAQKMAVERLVAALERARSAFKPETWKQLVTLEIAVRALDLQAVLDALRGRVLASGDFWLPGDMLKRDFLAWFDARSRAEEPKV